MRTSQLVITVVAISISFSTVAQAASTYQFVFDQANYDVAPGGTVAVHVFLREMLGPVSPSVLDTEGLSSAGVEVSFNNAPLPTDPAKVLDTFGIIPNPLFDGSGGMGLVNGISAGFHMEIFASSPVVLPTGGPSVFDALLGTFIFTAGVVPGEVTHLVATDFNPLFDDNITGLSNVLDSLISDGFATITVVPEPSGLLLAAISALGFIAAGRRRTHRN
jgi:hypothetical protein